MNTELNEITEEISEKLNENKKEEYSRFKDMIFQIGLLFVLVVVLGLAYFTINQFVTFKEYYRYLGKANSSFKPIITTTFMILIYLALIYSLKKPIENPNDQYEKRNKSKLKVLKKIIAISICINITLLPIYSIIYLEMFPSEHVENTNEELKRIAVHESGHCLVNEILKPEKTIELRIFNAKDKDRVDRYIYSKKSRKLPLGIHRTTSEFVFKEDFYNDIQVSLAGLLAQELLSDEGEATYGAGSDIKSIEKSVIALVNNGLTELGPITWDVLTSDEKQNVYRKIVDPLYADTKKIILENKDKILRLSEDLAREKILSGSRVREILELNNKDQD
ncbi:MAG: hypothetical protein N4A68_05425 [Maledivibacter sp.]|jgi:hypothetical protein|nr:hypothetical protein [Maledivibacter sp.]